MSAHANAEVPIPALRRVLLAWYGRHARALPWRRGRRAADPYCVWVAEIMLQQTRAATVTPYYERFLARFPTLMALAEAEEEAVLAAWSGLGYYRRARYLSAAARLVMERHGGEVPATSAPLRALPGVGAYTAAAILSIAYQQPLPAVDGNLARVTRRISGRALTLAQATVVLQAWIAPRRPGQFNQAMMDLGATVCLPKAPLCGRCPLRFACHTRGEDAVAKRPPPVPSHEAYGLYLRGGRVWLRQRPATESQMPGMYELPRRRRGGRVLGEVRHTITTRSIRAAVYAMAARPPVEGGWYTPQQAGRLPLTGLTRKILRNLCGWGELWGEQGDER